MVVSTEADSAKQSQWEATHPGRACQSNRSYTNQALGTVQVDRNVTAAPSFCRGKGSAEKGFPLEGPRFLPGSSAEGLEICKQKQSLGTQFNTYLQHRLCLLIILLIFLFGAQNKLECTLCLRACESY